MAITDVFGLFAGEDIVSILDESGEQAFALARPVSVSVGPEIQYMTHPVENGSVITDHRVVLPVLINMTVILAAGNYRDTYQEIRQAAIESRAFVVQTKSNTFNNMQITAYPSEEDTALFDTVTVNLSFREIQFDNARTQVLSQNQVSNPADSSTTNRGDQSGTSVSDSVGSILSGIFG